MAYICTGVQTSVNEVLNIFRNFCLHRPELDLKFSYELKRTTANSSCAKPTFPWKITVAEGITQLLEEELG